MLELVGFLNDWRMAWMPVVGVWALWQSARMVCEMAREDIDDFRR